MANGTAGAREAALYVLARCRRFDAWSQQTIQTAAEKFSLDERDTALCTKLCLDVLQNAALCDYYIGCYSSVPAAKLEPNLLDILRLGVCQLLFMDKIPVSAAVNEAVEQTKRSGSRAAGLVNAVLRRVAENRENLPEIPNIGTAQELSVRFSHPLWLCERMVSELGYDGAHAFFAASNRAPQLTNMEFEVLPAASLNLRYWRTAKWFGARSRSSLNFKSTVFSNSTSSSRTSIALMNSSRVEKFCSSSGASKWI